MKTGAVSFCLFDAGVNLGSKLAPSMEQAQRQESGGAAEVLSASLLSGDLWNPMDSIDSKVSFFRFCFLLDFSGPKF